MPAVAYSDQHYEVNTSRTGQPPAHLILQLIVVLPDPGISREALHPGDIPAAASEQLHPLRSD